MTRVKQAIEKAKKAFIESNPAWADREYRIQLWKQLHPIQREMILDQLTLLAQADMEYPYPLEVKEDDNTVQS